MSKSIPFVYELAEILAGRGEASCAQLADECQKSMRQIHDALSSIAKKGGCEYDRSRNRWKHVAAIRGRPALYITPEQREAVYDECHGVRRQDVEQVTGLPGPVVARCLKTLAAKRRIQHTERGWEQTDAPLPPSIAPSLSITPDDLAWQKYWSPANRQNRLRERA